VTYSLRARLLLAASVVLAAFLGLTGLVLDRAFRTSAEAALEDRLQGHIYALLASAELDAGDTMVLPDELPDPRFAVAGSGLYAEVARGDGRRHWRSKSALGLALPFQARPAVGARAFESISTQMGTALHGLSFGVSWDDSQGRQRRYIFRVAESLEPFYAQVRSFRRNLWGWLGAAALLLLAVQGSILRWGLAPLRRVADDLAAIEAGRAQCLTGTYPAELRGLTDNLNALIASAQTHLVRYRDSLGNLAHSLKTPLAVLRGAVDTQASGEQLHALAHEQVERMTQIIDYQLQRAAASGRVSLTAPVPVAPKIRQVIAALTKVYADKPVSCELDVDNDAVFYGDEGDLLEILGNVADNAFKWCRQRVLITARVEPVARAGHGALALRVEDDGPGIPEEMIARVLQRGERADPATAGHGIGLAMAWETARIYGGSLSISAGELGGAAVTMRFASPRAAG